MCVAPHASQLVSEKALEELASLAGQEGHERWVQGQGPGHGFRALLYAHPPRCNASMCALRACTRVIHHCGPLRTCASPARLRRYVAVPTHSAERTASPCFPCSYVPSHWPLVRRLHTHTSLPNGTPHVHQQTASVTFLASLPALARPQALAPGAPAVQVQAGGLPAGAADHHCALRGVSRPVQPGTQGQALVLRRARQGGPRRRAAELQLVSSGLNKRQQPTGHGFSNKILARLLPRKPLVAASTVLYFGQLMPG